MVLNNFYLNVVVRVTCIMLTSLVLGVVLQHLGHGYYYTLAGMVSLIVLQTYLLINLVNKTNSDLDKFLSSIQDHDSSVRFFENPRDAAFKKLHDRMNNVNTIIQHTKIEHETARNMLQMVVDHIDIGLLAFNSNGRIEISNQALMRLLNISHLNKVDAFNAINGDVYSIIKTIKPGEEILHKWNAKMILIKATALKFENDLLKLVSFDDITHELNKKELESWQKLIRVLTHEIMNSISPITSLTSVIAGYFRSKDNEKNVLPNNINQQIITKTLTGLNTIEETGKGLMDFVAKFRSLTSLPKPELSTFTVDGLLLKCKLLMQSNIPGNIKIITTISPEDVAVTADYTQVELILINLIKNASEALQHHENGTIHLKAFYEKDYTVIQVEDNGMGIPREMLDDIFIPFFTTKNNGSGIGLSISRQIMQNHQGSVSVCSELNRGTVFTLKFVRRGINTGPIL